MSKGYRDADKLREAYLGQGKTIKEVADHFGVSWPTIQRWIKEHDIPTREKSWAQMKTTKDKGYETWYSSGERVYVHRLLAVAEYGVSELEGKHVHHRNELSWDNRASNIELVSPGEHNNRHRKAPPIARKAIAYAYEFTDMTSREVAETCDYSQNSVLRIHGEFFD